ncbi:hypothetical protein [Methylorubrum extorquens]
MQLEQTLQVEDIAEQAPRRERDLLTPTLLAAGGVLTIAWTGFLGWGAVSLVSYLIG